MSAGAPGPTRRIPKPRPGEYPAYAESYMALLPEGEPILDQLARNVESTIALVRSLPSGRLTYRYAPGKWTIKEIVAHLSDDERIYAYRALRFARNDSTELPGFDQDTFNRYSNADSRPVDDLLDELAAVRRATVLLFAGLPEEAFDRSGVADGSRSTVRSLVWHIAGHEVRHGRVIRERYL